jgi:porin
MTATIRNFIPDYSPTGHVALLHAPDARAAAAFRATAQASNLAGFAHFTHQHENAGGGEVVIKGNKRLLAYDLLAGGLVGACLCVAALPASAADPQTNVWPDDWLGWQTMTGDWGGLRTDLQNDGIKVNAHYVSEAAGNPVGGLEQGGAEAGEFGFGIDMKSDILGWEGGTFHSLITERAGSNLSKAKIGNLLTVQEIYGDGQTTRITQLSYEQTLFSGLLDVEAGRMNVENDFATSPKYFGQSLYCNFQNNSICGTPIAAPINSNGYVAYPASSLGAKVKLFLQKNIYVETGAYEVNPSLYAASNGFKFGPSGAQGVFTPVEAGITPYLGGLAGNYRVGAYYDNSDNTTAVGQATKFLPANSPLLSSLPMEMRAGRYGGWVQADQEIEGDTEGKKGTVLFSAFEWGDRATSLITWYGEAGIVRSGTFAGRDADTVALGFALANINSELLAFQKANGTPATAEEMMLELNYGYALAPWLNLRPGVQYVWHPDGEAERRNAVVLMLKTGVTF